MKSTLRTLVAVATYNEIENLPRLVDEIFRYAPDVDILVIDDNSPDGTGQWCDERAAVEGRLHCLHREGKLGLGTATLAGMQYAIDNDYTYILTMDADFSHPPKYLSNFLSGMDDIDVMIGSRYVRGGGIEGWPWRRRMMSRLINIYARVLLGLKTKDCSGAFRCYRTQILKQLEPTTVRSSGYAYLEEILWRLKRKKARFAETPFVFVDRIHGETKINMKEAAAALWIIFRLGLKNWLRV